MAYGRGAKLWRADLAFWGILLSLVLLCLTVRYLGDVLGVLRLVIFGPRYLILLPFLALAGGAAFFKSKLHWASLLLACTACCWLILDFRVGGTHGPSTENDVSVLTLNVQVNSENHDLVRELVDLHRPDFVALQETTSELYSLPPEYHVYDYGEHFAQGDFNAGTRLRFSRRSD